MTEFNSPEGTLAALDGIDNLPPDIQEGLNSLRNKEVEAPQDENQPAPDNNEAEPPAEDVETPAPNKEEPEPNEEEPTEDKNEEVEDEGIEIDTPFGKKKFGGKKKVEVDIPELPEEVSSFIKNKYGVDDPKKAFESFDKWRTQAQQAADADKKIKESEGKIESIQKFFDQLPPDMVAAIDKFSKGEDYKSEFAKNHLDFNKKADEYKAETLVDHFMPGKITQEDWDEYYSRGEFKGEEPSPSTKRMIDLAIEQSNEKFNLEKSNYEKNRAGILAQQDKRTEAYKQSIEGSESYLKENLPGISDDIVSSVKDTFSQGPRGIIDFYFDKDGSLKPDAMVNMAMAKEGMNYAKVLEKQLEERYESRTNEEILNRSAEKRNRGALNSQVEGPSKELVDKLKNEIGLSEEEIKRLGVPV